PGELEGHEDIEVAELLWLGARRSCGISGAEPLRGRESEGPISTRTEMMTARTVAYAAPLERRRLNLRKGDDTHGPREVQRRSRLERGHEPAVAELRPEAATGN